MRNSPSTLTPVANRHPVDAPSDAALQAARLLNEALLLLGSDQARSSPAQTARTTERLIRLPEVKRLTGLGRTAIYDHMKQKSFPKSVKAGPRIAAWRESAIQAWIAERVDRHP